MDKEISRTTITTPPCPSTLDSDYVDIIKDELQFGNIELTLAIIKPEAFRHASTIEKIIKNEGFKVIQKRTVHLTPEQACDFYFSHYGESGFPKMVVSLSNGPLVAMSLAREQAVSHWNTMMGPNDVTEAKTLFPNCLRSYFGDLQRGLNGLHGSESAEIAQTEIHFFFPKIIVQDVLTEQERIDFLNEMLNPTLVKGLVELSRAKPADPMLWLADWLLDNNPYQPKMHPELQHIPT